MGSYSNLYIGSYEFSWKSYIPDFPCLLFEASDFVSILQKDDEYGDYYQHKFISNCGKAKFLLENAGINLTLLRKIHFDYFAFNFVSYKEDLIYRCNRYLESKNPERVAKQSEVDKLSRRLLMCFKSLNQDEEFFEVLDVFKAKGDREEYINNLKNLLERHEPNQSKADLELDMTQFLREYLTNFLKKILTV